MEEINTSLENIVAKYNDSITHSAPKKLSFEQLSDSLDDSNTAKRPHLSSSFVHNMSRNGSPNGATLNVTNNSEAGLSPWQARVLNADLIEAKSMIKRLKKQINKELSLRRDLEINCDNKVETLKYQCDVSSKKITEQDDHMKELRRRERFAKQNEDRAQLKLQQEKLAHEETKAQYQRDKSMFEQELLRVKNHLTNELSEYKRCVDKMQMELELTKEELEKRKLQSEDYKIRASAADELNRTNEKLKQELDFANARVKELEADIASYSDWKEVTKNTQARLLRIPEMQQEIEHLKTQNKHLNDLVGNKLVLEEQLHDCKTRLEKEESARSEAVTLQVKLSYVEQELKEWVKVAQDHCLPNTLVSPMALRSRIEQLLQNDIIMVAEKTTTQTEAKAVQAAMQELQQKCDFYMKNNDDLNITLKRHKNFKERLQRKLRMVSRERDFYKQLLDNFDKDLTISNTTSTDFQADAHVRYRLEVLERTLLGYKEMCANLEKEMNVMRQQDVIIEPVGEGYDQVKKELDALRLENDKLRRKKDELELELEHRYLKGDFNMSNYKIVHLINNPAAEAYEGSKNIIEKLQAEIERLKRRNKQLEEDNESTLAKLNETSNMTMNFKEMNQLRAELDSTNSKLKKIKECYKAASIEFRDVTYMLLGYRIDRIGANSNYKLSSMYAESPDDYLNFRLNESNVLELLETPYSVTLKPLIDTQLVTNKSFPAFLSTLTMELFQKATITIS